MIVEGKRTPNNYKNLLKKIEDGMGYLVKPPGNKHWPCSLSKLGPRRLALASQNARPAGEKLSDVYETTVFFNEVDEQEGAQD